MNSSYLRVYLMSIAQFGSIILYSFHTIFLLFLFFILHGIFVHSF